MDVILSGTPGYWKLYGQRIKDIVVPTRCEMYVLKTVYRMDNKIYPYHNTSKSTHSVCMDAPDYLHVRSFRVSVCARVRQGVRVCLCR